MKLKKQQIMLKMKKLLIMFKMKNQLIMFKMKKNNKMNEKSFALSNINDMIWILQLLPT